MLNNAYRSDAYQAIQIVCMSPILFMFICIYEKKLLLLFNECGRAMISETVAAMRREIYE